MLKSPYSANITRRKRGKCCADKRKREELAAPPNRNRKHSFTHFSLLTLPIPQSYKMTSPNSPQTGVSHTPSIGVSHTTPTGVTHSCFEATGAYFLTNLMEPPKGKEKSPFDSTSTEYLSVPLHSKKNRQWKWNRRYFSVQNCS